MIHAAPAMKRPELRCLGTVSLAGPSGPLAARTRKQVALLLFLARRGGRAVSRDELIELLWSEDPLKPARHSLSQSASLMNRVLGAEVIATARKDRMVVAPEALWLDVNEFERLASSGQPDAALALWRGTLLEGLWIRRAPNFERWLGEERDRLQRIFRRLAHGRIEVLRERGDHVGMREEAERLLALDALDEKAMLVHLEALMLVDDRSLALRRFRDFEQRLRRELDAEPGPALRSWIKRHRKPEGGAAAWRHLPLPRISEVTVLPAPQPLFGRTEEFALLWDAWEQAKQGKGSFIIIEGEAGIGKTALATKLVNQAHVEGASVCFVKCYRTEKSVPFAPVTALIRQLARLPGFVALDPVWIGELTRLVPELRERFPGAPQPMAVDDAARHRLSDATVQAALAVADELPLMIVIDDLQDADEASLAAIHYLARHKGVPVLAVSAHRPLRTATNQEQAFAESMQSGGLGRFLRLGALEAEDVDRLIQHVAASRGIRIDASAHTAAANASSGNPLRVIEFVVSGAPSVASRSDPISEVHSTDSFEQTAIARLAALPPSSKLLASALAVSGHPLTEHEAAALTRLKPADLAMAIISLTRSDFCIREGVRLRLAHERYAGAIEAATPDHTLTALHHRLARLLARVAANSPAIRIEAARHYEASGNQKAAAAQSLHAARYAASLGAVRSEADALELGLRVSKQHREALACWLADCYLQLGQRDRIVEIGHELRAKPDLPQPLLDDLTYLELAASLDAEGTSMVALQEDLSALALSGRPFAHSRIALVLLIRVAHRTGAKGLAKKAARQLRRTGADRFSRLGAVYLWSKYYKPNRCIRLLKLALPEAQAENDWATESLCRDVYGIVLKQLGRFEESVEQFAISLALARRTMNIAGEARSLQNRAVSEMSCGELPRVLATLDEVDALPVAAVVYRALTEYNRAIVNFDWLRFEQALHHFSTARDMATRQRQLTALTESSAGVALCHLYAGRFDGFRVEALKTLELDGIQGFTTSGWIVGVMAAWNRALYQNDVNGARTTLKSIARRLRHTDVAHWLAVERHLLWFNEYWAGCRLDEERYRLLEYATNCGATHLEAILTVDGPIVPEQPAHG